MHKQGVAHRDIKPQNILLGDNFEVKICDFSRAVKIQDINSKSKNRDGTRGYTAPQIRDPRKQYDERVDVWSYGCTLYQMATGSLPFKGLNYNEQYSSVNFDTIPASLSSLLKGIWRFNPDERFTAAKIINHPFFTGKDLNESDLVDKPQYCEVL